MEPPAPPLHRAAAFQARRTQIRLLEAFPDVFGIRKSLREPGTWPGRAGVRAHPVGTFVISGSVPCTRNVLSLLKKTGRPGTPDVGTPGAATADFCSPRPLSRDSAHQRPAWPTPPRVLPRVLAPGVGEGRSMPTLMRARSHTHLHTHLQPQTTASHRPPLCNSEAQKAWVSPSVVRAGHRL